jgi:hypothetical protein
MVEIIIISKNALSHFGDTFLGNLGAFVFLTLQFKAAYHFLALSSFSFFFFFFLKKKIWLLFVFILY